MTYKFLGHCQTLEQLKQEYRALALKVHPDCGGNESDMIALNNEYDELSQRLPKTNAQGETYQPKERECPEQFRSAVMVAMHMNGVQLELCGCWLWATGNTREHKDELKAAGYKWSANKAAWYWHEDGYHKHGKKSYSLDEIRAMHGSASVNVTEKQKIPA
jgi:curved DNA-binding protein CbpA